MSNLSDFLNKKLSDPIITLDGTEGTAGQVLISQGAGLPPAWGGAGSKIMIVEDQKPQGTSGGQSYAGSTQTRTLNTVVVNDISGASLSSNTITLPAGTYRIRASATAGRGASKNRAWLLNSSTSSVAIYGVTTSAGPAGYGGGSNSLIEGQITIASTSNFQVKHWTEGTESDGFGLPANISGMYEIYTRVFIEKVA